MSDKFVTNDQLIEPELLTHVECVQILCKILNGKNGKLLGYKLKPELAAIGYLGKYYQLKLSYQLDNETAVHEKRLFVKAVLQINDESYFNDEKAKIFQKETILYEQLLNELRIFSTDIWCAACYLVKKNVFVMENIVDLDYVPIQNSNAFLNELQTKSVLKGLALLHASSIAYERKFNIDIGEKFAEELYEATVLPTVAWYTTGLKAVLALIAQHPKYQSEEQQDFIKNDLPNILDTIYNMVNPSEKYRNVFCHRDAWIGNFFFSNSVNDRIMPCIFVDFQLCRYAPAAIDVLMALYLNLEPKVRKANMQQYCRYYYNEFATALKDMKIRAGDEISLSEFERSIEDLELFGALYNCIAATVLRVPADYLISLKRNQPEVYLRYAQVDRVKEVFELVETNKAFGSYMNECIEDLMSLNFKQETKL